MMTYTTHLRSMFVAACAATVVVASISSYPTLPKPIDIAGLSTPTPKPLRVIAPEQTIMAGDLTPFGQGFEVELLESYARGMGFEIEWLPGTGPQEAWAAVESGEADLAIGYGFQAPEHLDSLVQAGPAYITHRPVVVYNHGNPDRDMRRGEVDLCSVQMAVSAELEVADSFNRGCLEFGSAASAEYAPMLDTLNTEEEGVLVVEDGRFRLWQPFFKELRQGGEVSEEIAYRWIWRADNERLATTLQSFWEYQDESKRLFELRERYFGFLPEKTDFYELSHISKILEQALPEYAETITAAAQENGIDPLLLTAVIYQESRFNAGAVSHTGVRGLMQITENTARHLGIDRNDPHQSIEGGARYLREMYDKLEKYDLSEWDRWFLTLAAYNQGPGHLSDAMRLARKLGTEGRTWLEVKEAFPLLSYEKYYSQARNGYCRGREAVGYVDNVRYFYYILHGLVVLSRPESEHLASLLGIIPKSWPGI